MHCLIYYEVVFQYFSGSAVEKRALYGVVVSKP